MVVVGGITRLTGSGLSITEWKVISGSIPPLNEAQWLEAFEKYKQIPQYQQQNSHFELADFKFIYFWEFIHRLFGRLIGVVFLFGLIYFLWRKAITVELLPKLLFMFVLGGLQGFLGWYMVSSGLTQNVRVSHIRLAIHLTFAFITFGYIFWVALTQLFDRKAGNGREVTKFRKAAKILLGLLTLQIIYGAFVAGSKAGLIYNTWPKMYDDWVPEAIGYSFQKDGISSLINNLASMQFIHRGLAYILTIFTIVFMIKIFKMPTLHRSQKRAVYILMEGIFGQVLLGIVTLLFSVPIVLGVLHQAFAFFLFAALIYLIHRLRYE
ncbi:MAG: COX15/CtaA family protein [Bacteroidetes bacterium]|nr:COX15/CtaA family protein [Bacteroidota bacterium]